jgi:hypothetical protein
MTKAELTMDGWEYGLCAEGINIVLSSKIFFKRRWTQIELCDKWIQHPISPNSRLQKKNVLGSKRPMQCNKEGGMQKFSDFLFLIFLWFWKIKPLTQFIKNNTQPPIEMATPFHLVAKAYCSAMYSSILPLFETAIDHFTFSKK